MILQMRRNGDEVIELLNTGFMYNPIHCEFIGAIDIINSFKEAITKNKSIMPSLYYFELVTKKIDPYDERSVNARERVHEIPAEIDTAEALHEWYMMEVQ